MKYVKNILLLSLLVLLSLSSKAWVRRTDSTLFLSIHGDVLYTHLKNHIYGSDFSPGFGPGFGVNAYFTKWQEFGFTAGMGYNKRRFSVDNSIALYNNINEQIGQTRAHFKFDYINFPFTARYNFGERFNMYLDAGIRLNILLSAEKYADPDSLPEETAEPNSYQFDVVEDHPKLCISIQGGGGVEYFIKSNFAVYIDYKYIQDISPLFVYENLPAGARPKMFAHNLEMGIRWGIPIKYSVNERFQ
ncbi:MAG: porin family protein [Bacteroidota bacterium]